MLSLLLLTAVLIGVVHTGEALHCYTCNSIMDKQCGDPVSVKYIGGMNCQDLTEDLPHKNIHKKILLNHTSDYIYGCQKIKISDSQGVKFIVRTCSIVRNKRADKLSCNMNDSIIVLTGGQGNLDYCGMCYTDYCNGGYQLKHGFVFSALLSLASVMIWN